MSDVVVRDIEGRSVRLFSLWEHRRVVLCFTRHFGCLFCKQQIAGLNQIHDTLAKHDVGLVAIAVGGDAAKARQFQKEQNYKGELYYDPDPKAPSSFATFNLISGAGTLMPDADDTRGGFGPLQAKKEVFEASVAADAQGFMSDDMDYSKVSPELLQRIGGIFVLGPGNQCDYSYRSSFAGDHADLAQVLQFATGCTAEGEDIVYPSTQAWVDELHMSQRYSESRECYRGKDSPAASSSPTSSPNHQPRQNPSTKEREKDQKKTKQQQQQQQQQQEQQQKQPDTNAKTSTKTERSILTPTTTTYMNTTVLSLPVFVVFSCLAAFVILVQTKVQHTRSQDSTVETWSALVAVLCSRDIGVAAVGLLLLVVVATFTASPRGGTRGAGAGNTQEDKDAFELTLYQPNQVDALTFESGVDCDCSFIQLTNVTDKVDHCLRSRNNSHDSLGASRSGSFEANCISGSGVDDNKALVANVALPAEKVSDENILVMSQSCCYLREFLGKPHPLVGRKGPVCPFVPRSLKLGSLHLGVIRTEGPTGVDVVERAARSFVKRYAQLEPREGKNVVYKAVILLFPDVPLKKAPQVIDDVQAALKPEFVKQGLMIGEFHKHNNASGLRNPDFYPLRTPHPSLAIRKIVPTDLVFLDMSRYAADIRVSFLSSYLEQFEGDTAPSAKKAIQDASMALKEARRELAGGA